jgi:hypothetical protein
MLADARSAAAITIVPAPGKIVAKATSSTGREIADLHFSGLPEEPVYAGDQIDGTFIIHAKQEFSAVEVSIYLVLRSTVHRLGSFPAKKKYLITRNEVPAKFERGRSSELDFSFTVPESLPASSIDSLNVGQLVEDSMRVVPRFRPESRTKNTSFSASWYLEGRIRRRRAVSLKIQSHLTIFRERDTGERPIGGHQAATDARFYHREQREAVLRRREQREEIRRRLVELKAMTDTQHRGLALSDVLNQLFSLEGLQVRQSPIADDSNHAVSGQNYDLIKIEGLSYVLKASWNESPADLDDISGILVDIYGRQDVQGLIIFSSGYKGAVVEECRRALAQRVVVLAEVYELLLLLERNCELQEWIKVKIHTALVGQNPFLQLSVADLDNLPRS